VREGDAPALGDRVGVALAIAAEIPSAAPVLRLRGVGRRFGGVQAVRDVDLELREGERRALLGPNGAGKTTLFNVVSGELAPSAGSVELFGSDVTYLPVRRRARLGLARTFQTSRLLLGLTVEDNLYLAVLGTEGGRLRAVSIPVKDRAFRQRARAAADRVGLGGRLGALVGSLSHGEQRQLEVGMAFAQRPRLLMLDEPAAGLSRGERQTLAELLGSLERSITVLLIEHDMDVALGFAERVTMMHDGRVIVEGTPDEIRGNQLVHDLYLGRGYGGE
jgi:branched-chain amino acid transport system ATP-binding protein